MAMLGAFDIHRSQLTFDVVCSETGEVRRGQIRPADRPHLRDWLSRYLEGESELAVEGCTGWRYVIEEFERAGCRKIHMAEPAEAAERKGPKHRAKTDWADARHLRELLEQGRIPESWIPPTVIQEARIRGRLYKALMEERTAWAERIQATLFHQGVPQLPNVIRPQARGLLPDVELSPAGRLAVEVSLRQADHLGQQAAALRKDIQARARRLVAPRALVQRHEGIGFLLAYVIWAEDGDVRRFTSSDDSVRFSGLDITVLASDRRRAKGHLSKQGSPLLRWAFYQGAMAATHSSSPDHAYYLEVKERHQGDGEIALLAVARKLCRRCYHTLRELGEAWLDVA